MSLQILLENIKDFLEKIWSSCSFLTWDQNLQSEKNVEMLNLQGVSVIWSRKRIEWKSEAEIMQTII